MSNSKLTVSNFINWVAPKQPGEHQSCVQCGRKVGKNPFWVQVSIAGEILPANVEVANSQGYWAVGSECAKDFDMAVLVKN